jgi:cyclopropane fatty-acyl-phospholipid synthase-like methyltransferase
MWFEIILLFFCILVLYHLRNGAIFVPTNRLAVGQMVKLAAVRPGMRVADLGSGDGRIVIAFAQAGAIVDGYEINPLLSWWSKFQISRLRLGNARIVTASFWPVDLSAYDVVVVFGITHIMERLQKKLAEELHPDTLIISHIFKFPGWTPIIVEGGVRIYKIS